MSKHKVPFNKPYLTGKETHYIYDAVMNKGQLSGNGYYTKKCQNFFKERYGFNHCLLTSSCTDALEMCSLLIDTKPGDEIIIPSYTFVSTANPFLLRGGKVIFGDSAETHPNISLQEIKRLTTNKTKAVVVVHYAGQGYEIDKIQQYCKEKGIYLIEDAAQAIESYYKDQPLGSFGDLSTFSFHETKNIISGEGGLLVVNNPDLVRRSEIIWEKGTNRAEFFRGEVNKYGWVDLGSSFLPSELTAAFLWAQLEEIDNLISLRISKWDKYFSALSNILEGREIIKINHLPNYNSNNAHIFYLVCKNIKIRTQVLNCLNNHGVNAVFHYLPLHKSDFFSKKYNGSTLKNSEYYSDGLIRLPLYCGLTDSQMNLVIRAFETSLIDL